MADRIPAGIDPAGIRNIIGDQINPATEETLQDILAGLDYSSGLITDPFDFIEIVSKNDDGEPTQIVYKFSGATVATIDIVYDSDGDIKTVTKT